MKLLAKIMTLTLSLTVAVSVAAADGIPHRQVADMLYELAFANRKVYTRDIVQRLSNRGIRCHRLGALQRREGAAVAGADVSSRRRGTLG